MGGGQKTTLGVLILSLHLVEIGLLFLTVLLGRTDLLALEPQGSSDTATMAVGLFRLLMCVLLHILLYDDGGDPNSLANLQSKQHYHLLAPGVAIKTSNI